MFLLRVRRVGDDAGFGVGVEHWEEFTWLDRMDKIKRGRGANCPKPWSHLSGVKALPLRYP